MARPRKKVDNPNIPPIEEITDKSKYIVRKVYNENQLEETLNYICGEGYEVQQIFLRSYFVPSSPEHRQMYYAIIFRRIA